MATPKAFHNLARGNTPGGSKRITTLQGLNNSS